MNLWAIIPVKPFNRGKSRMSGLLGTSEREMLNRNLLSHTLTVLKSVPDVKEICTISKDPAALEMSNSLGTKIIRESTEIDLNSALETASQLAVDSGAESILVLPADLPVVRASDIMEVIQGYGGDRAVVVAPDRHRRGTNALLITPPGLIKFEFGPDSFNKHCNQAEALQAELTIVENYRLGLDIDVPDDLLLAASPVANEDIIQATVPRKLKH